MNSRKISFGEKLRAFYQRSKATLAYVLLALILLSQFLPEDLIDSSVGNYSQLGLSVAFGFLVLEILFEINRQVSKKETEKLQRFQDWNSALPEVKELLELQIQKETSVKIKVIGVSLRHHWYFLKGIIEPLLAQGKKKEVSIEMAMLGPEFYEHQAHVINDDFVEKYKLQGQSIELDINRFKKEFASQFESNKWNIDVYKYSYLPNMVGLSIDDKYLFIGLTYWKDQTFRAGGSDYEFFKEDDTFGGFEKIEIFNSWFAYIKSGDRSASASQGG